jgi:branched-chain amino acid aminotransferase
VFVFLNGHIIAEEDAVISAFDRGFLYGDGLFETVRLVHGKPVHWRQHLDRLQRGADFLKITLPFFTYSLPDHVQDLARRNATPDAILRITVSRGIGLRGYSPKGADSPTLLMSMHPSPQSGVYPDIPRWRLSTSSIRLRDMDPLAQYKTCNKLHQIVARAEAEAAGADEALLLNTGGFPVETASSNLFWIEGETVCTPPLDSGVLPGITRAAVLDLCKSLAIPTNETLTKPDRLVAADGVFLTNSAWGVVEAEFLDGARLKPCSLTRKIHQAYEERIRHGVA